MLHGACAARAAILGLASPIRRMPLSNAPAPGPGKAEDRRAARRKPLHVTAILRFAGAPPLQARTIDLSAGGLSVNSPVPLPERAACEVEFPLLLRAGVHRMQLKARVAYSVLSATEGFKTGLQFVGVTAADGGREARLRGQQVVHRIVHAPGRERARRHRGQCGGREHLAHHVLRPRDAELDAAPREQRREVAQRLDARAVEVGRLLQAQHEALHRAGRAGAERGDVLAQRVEHPLGIREEQRHLGPRHQQPRRGHGLRVQVAVDEVVRAGQAREPAHARRGQLLQRGREAERDAHEQPVQHAQQQHRHHRGHGHEAIALPREEGLQRAHIGGASQRVHHHRGQHRLRRQRDPRQAEGHDQREHRAGRQPADAAARAGRHVGRGGREARAHRHAAQQPGGEVGQAERDQVAVGLHGAGRGEAADRGVRLGIEDQRDRQRQLAQARPGVQREQRQRRQLAQAERELPGERDAVFGGPAAAAHEDAQRQHDEAARQALDAREHREHRQSRQAEREARAVPRRGRAQPQPQRRKELARADVHAGHRGELAQDDRPREPEREAAQHRLGDEVGDAAQPRHRGGEEQRAGHQDQPRGPRQAQGGIEAFGTAERGRQQCRRRRGGRHHREPAGADKAVAEQPREQREHAGLRRQAADVRVRHRLGQQQAGQRGGGDEVRPGDAGAVLHGAVDGRPSYPRACGAP
jgi:hypothetical protein